MSSTRMTAILIGVAMAAASAVPTSGGALAADLGKEVATATFHAGLAAGAKDLKTARMHLHHVLNCLVGVDGGAYDAAEMNPCKDQGNGAMIDTSDETQRKTLQTAIDQAKAGATTTDLDGAVKAASDTQTTLKSFK